jgi:CDP-diacylglycerol--glycerol-3-phosphate 3-phosphatidyltransferase
LPVKDCQFDNLHLAGCDFSAAAPRAGPHGKELLRQEIPCILRQNVSDLFEAGEIRGTTVKITANMVTILRIVLMPIPVYLLYGEGFDLLLALLIIIILGLTDLLDGIMARREGTTVLGGLLDPIADKIFIAVIYLPLTDRGIIPVWLTAAMFSRDFAVTSLRTMLSLRDAPMRTSMLAKYKTAIQMTGIGYVILFLAYKNDPDAFLSWFAISAPIVLPLGLIVYRAITRKKQGPRSATMLALMSLGVVLRLYVGPENTMTFIIYGTGLLTVVSGFSYFIDAWSALKKKAGHVTEIVQVVLEGAAVPVIFVCVYYFYHSAFASAVVITVIALELALGGLCNLLASLKIKVPFRRGAAKSVAQVIIAASALTVAALGQSPIVGQVALFVSLILTFAYTVAFFVRHKNAYLSVM